MKKRVIVFSVLVHICVLGFGQFWSCPGWPVWTMDSTSIILSWGGEYKLLIDTVSNPNNQWQLGVPKKTVIQYAYSSPNALITDTINPYPVNDTSVFFIRFVDGGGFSMPHTNILSGYYQVNSDSLKDYGTIEVSLDQGNTWVNILIDTIYPYTFWWDTPKPVLTGSSNGWQYFFVSFGGLGNYITVNDGDTIYLKFTFISDSIFDNFDGLAFDNFRFCNYSEGIEEIKKHDLIEIYPNPTNDFLFIHTENAPVSETIQIYNYSGQLLFQEFNYQRQPIDIRKLGLSNGLYLLAYSDTKSWTVKKFVVKRL